MSGRSFLTKDTLSLGAAAVFVGFVASVAASEGAISGVTAPIVAAVNDFDPHHRTEGFVREAQDHVFAEAICVSIGEKEALNIKEFNTVAICRAKEKHSIFFGPTLRELIKSEVPMSQQPGNTWYQPLSLGLRPVLMIAG